MHWYRLFPVQVTDSFGMATDVALSLEHACKLSVIATELTEEGDAVYDEEKGAFLSKELQGKFQKVCPNHCSKNGICVNGTCQCFDGELTGCV